jgi:uncharacterized protein
VSRFWRLGLSSMIGNTFVHLPGIGPETEARFWAAGVRTWDDLESNLPDLIGAGKKALKVAQALAECRAAHESGELGYFQERLKGADMWRLLPALLDSGEADRIAYLDIETTGLGFPPACQSTTIAVLFKGKLELEHQHDRKRLLMKELEREARMFVTFNGSTFDLPFLRREFRVDLKQPHIDLRYWMKAHGFSGGLKKIQHAIPAIPQREYMDIDGFDAVRLWNLHKRGVPNALETLYTYNAEDTLVLEHLIYHGLNMEAAKRKPLNLPEYKMPKARSIPYEVCPHVYRMIR